MQSDRFLLTGRLMRSVLQHWQVFTCMVICMIGAGLIQPLLPWGLAPLLDAASNAKDYPLPPEMLPYFMVSVITLLGIFSYGRSYLGGWLDATLQRDYRTQMAQRMLQLPLAQLQRDTSGMTTSRFMHFLPQMTSAIMPVSMALVQETIKALGYIALMLYWQWQLTFIVLLAAPIGAGMIRFFNKRMKKVAAAGQQATATTQGALNEVIAAAPVVKMAGEAAVNNRLSGAFGKLRGTVLRINVVLSAGQPLTHLLLALPFAVVVSLIVRDLAAGNMSAGEAASFLTAMLLLPTPVRVITRAMNTWEQMLVASREVFGFLDSTKEPDAGTRELTADAVRGAVAFNDITFRYDGTEGTVLKALTLQVNPGETLALVGRSGAGKTTLCNLLPRFYLPQQGEVQLDGVNINDYTLQTLRRQISLVPQKPQLFDDTVAANVAFPDTEVDAARLSTALQQAAADGFVSALPHGAHTRIGEGGNQLSGGQQQRLILARAFYRDSPLVILDEATSALDSDTESKLKQSLRQLLSGRTALIIAHRFATLDIADRIAVLDDGQLLAVGTVPELRATCPLFAEMYTAQQLD